MDGIIVKISITPSWVCPHGWILLLIPISIRLGYGICKEMQVNMVLARNSLCANFHLSPLPFREQWWCIQGLLLEHGSCNEDIKQKSNQTARKIQLWETKFCFWKILKIWELFVKNWANMTVICSGHKVLYSNENNWTNGTAKNE